LEISDKTCLKNLLIQNYCLILFVMNLLTTYYNQLLRLPRKINFNPFSRLLKPVKTKFRILTLDLKSIWNLPRSSICLKQTPSSIKNRMAVKIETITKEIEEIRTDIMLWCYPLTYLDIPCKTSLRCLCRDSIKTSSQWTMVVWVSKMDPIWVAFSKIIIWTWVQAIQTITILIIKIILTKTKIIKMECDYFICTFVPKKM